MSDAGGGAAASAGLEPEELARAGFYGLISRLFYGPADANLLAQIQRADNGGVEENELVAAWRKLQVACRSAFPAVLRQEYDSLFVGVGKAEVTPYLSAYADPVSPDRLLVRLRERLAGWGLARKEMVFEVEDHISGLCDVMRNLVERQHDLAEQRSFFEEFVEPGGAGFCAAVQKSSTATFYNDVAALTSSFFELERAAFEMSDSE